MALPADFNKIFGSTATGGLTPIGDVNYAKGWEFVGSNPPTKNDFSYLQNLSDLKSQWLYSNKLQRTDPFGDIKADGAAAVAAALSNLGLGDISKAGVASGRLGDSGYIAYPLIIDGVKRKMILQFGLTPVATAGSGTAYTCTLPTAFPTAFHRVFLCHDNSDDEGVGVASGTVLTLSTFSFKAIKIRQTGTTLAGQNLPASFHYLAIGYE